MESYDGADFREVNKCSVTKFTCYVFCTNSDETNLSRITNLFVASLSNRIVDRNAMLQGPGAPFKPHLKHPSYKDVRD